MFFLRLLCKLHSLLKIFLTTLMAQHIRCFLLMARLSGTHCPKTFGIRSVVLTLTDSRWRHFYFHSTSVFSALEVFTWMCYINLHLTFDEHTQSEFRTHITITHQTAVVAGHAECKTIPSVEWLVIVFSVTVPCAWNRLPSKLNMLCCNSTFRQEFMIILFQSSLTVCVT